jgi:hypothetical protein
MGSSGHFAFAHAPLAGVRATSPRPFVRSHVIVAQPLHGHLHSHVVFGNSCFVNGFFNPFLCQHFFRHQPFFVQPVFVSYPAYVEPSYLPTEEPLSADTGRQEDDLQTEVEGLKREVEQLREQEASQTQPAVQVRPSEKENAATTILVFRDGHRSELHNYAIVGHTLWVLTEERARKIPIADLDLDATKKVNADHGVDFQLP